MIRHHLIHVAQLDIALRLCVDFVYNLDLQIWEISFCLNTP